MKNKLIMTAAIVTAMTMVHHHLQVQQRFSL